MQARALVNETPPLVVLCECVCAAWKRFKVILLWKNRSLLGTEQHTFVLSLAADGLEMKTKNNCLSLVI